MQLFLAYPDTNQAASILDNSRLGNQCYRETKTLYNGGWRNHPAYKMIKDYPAFTAQYGLSLAQEMGRRNCWKPEVVIKWIKFWQDELNKYSSVDNPPWLGNNDFHASHRSNLIRKGICDLTFSSFRGKNGLPNKKSDWDNNHFLFAWKLFGKPQREKTHYGQFGWTEPDDLPYVWPVD